ncbi:acetate--CoA ligase family protein [Christensenellaceae bacterium OttesenSCG-928-M15]|nr:acetate--CoA ligase family protein [Christensenellaceae bacterium OttesenSCG-928-M15]
MSIHELLYPNAVAVVGSASPGKLGEVLTGRLVGGGFENVYCVNPKAQGAHGKQGYASIAEIGAKVDMIIIASPASTVAATLREAGKAGVKAAVIISSGFSEAGHPELEEDVKAAAKEYNIRYIGPNCAGLINTKKDLVASLEATPNKGRVSLISQSGAIGGVFMEKSKSAGIGVGKFLSFGNGTDVNGTELLRYLAEDEDTDVIGMYVENVKDGRPFMDALSYASAKKPVILIKSGRTAGGQRAAQSHTGAMAGADKVYDAAFYKCGAIRVDSLEDMLLLSKAFAELPKLKGKKVAIITNSGGPGVLTADRCETRGLDACAPSGSLKDALKEFLPPHAGLSNPLDITVEGTAEQYGETLKVSLTEYDAAVVIYVGTPYLKALPVAQALVAAQEQLKKPVAAYFEVGADIEQARAALNAGGIPCFDSGELAAEAFAGMARYGRPAGLLKADVAAKPLGKEYLLEPDCMGILKELGVSVPEYRLAKSAEEAERFAAEIGYPVCMKVVSKDIVHKSDVGGVKLNIADGAAAREAFLALEAVAKGKHFAGAILYPMLKKGVEVIMGLTRDPQFGPVVAFGVGGIFTEILKDVVLLPAPISLEEAKEMIASIKAYPLLKGARGAQGCDLNALALMLVKLSELMYLYEEIQEVDLNPVFAYPDGALAADVRMLL